MSKRTARKILTLATLATAPAAYASPKLAPPTSWADTNNMTVVVIRVQPYLVAPDVAPVPISYAEYGRYLGETQPLVGPDGRPGCGNVLGKAGDGGCNRERVLAVTKRLRAAAADKCLADTETGRDAQTGEYVTEAQQVVDAAKTLLASERHAKLDPVKRSK